jgi:hypothetical protein
LSHSIYKKVRIKIRWEVLKPYAYIGTDSGKRLCFTLCYDDDVIFVKVCTYAHTYHSRFIPKRVAEVSQILLRDAHAYKNYLAVRYTADVTSSKAHCSLSQA